MTKRLAQAFAEQARADMFAYNALSRSTLPACHRLHHLQMWLEKLCKAYLWGPSSEDEGRMVHNVVASVLPRVIARHWRKLGLDAPPNQRDLADLCREVDLLHPQIDDGGRRPDNVEYPWIDGKTGDACVPSDWKFLLSRRLETPTGRLLLKAATGITQQPTLIT